MLRLSAKNGVETTKESIVPTKIVSTIIASITVSWHFTTETVATIIGPTSIETFQFIADDLCCFGDYVH